ncbi:hypothetical protein [Phytoactinopolyspora endophytica]|uniref:hypothetical protein n=1 Tax=Phytoactinopolyspora endophytica TaxID=1642495 RepID=UPI00197C03F5|nr:hypothetical protein [Phytoactinopolyspora endophytica]
MGDGALGDTRDAGALDHADGRVDQLLTSSLSLAATAVRDLRNRFGSAMSMACQRRIKPLSTRSVMVVATETKGAT